MNDPISWQDFDPATLQAARAQDRPIVLVLTVPWCHHCRDLMQGAFAEPKAQSAIRDGFVAIRVDAERRPDVNERYGTGSWPTVAWLTPDGELIANDGFLEPHELMQRLDRVRAMWRDQRDELQRGLQEFWGRQREQVGKGGKLRRQMVDDIADTIYERFDHRHGGWGSSSKFPHPEAIDFALVLWQKRGDERMREIVTLTLDRMQASPIHDAVDGGFFRFSKTADWAGPNHEKLLEVNVRILRAYLEGYQVFGDERYRATADGIVQWMLGFLRDGATKAFYGSQDADADYYLHDAAGRKLRARPAVDRTIHCHANAMAVSSLLKASVVLGRPECRDRALETLAFLGEELFDGRDVYHYWDGSYHLPGMLADQAYLIRAFIDASQMTGDSDLLLPAEAIAERAIARQKAPGGGFYDIANDPRQSGPMRRRNRSILENSVMAEALVRLACLSRRPEFHDEGIAALEAFANDYKEYGYYVAGFGRAVDLVFYEPVVLTIVGDRDSKEAQELRHAALSTYVPSRMVQMLDPRHDPILIGRSGYKVESQPLVYLQLGKSTREPVRTPQQLLTALDQIGWERRGKTRRN